MSDVSKLSTIDFSLKKVLHVRGGPRVQRNQSHLGHNTVDGTNSLTDITTKWLELQHTLLHVGGPNLGPKHHQAFVQFMSFKDNMQKIDLVNIPRHCLVIHVLATSLEP